MRNNLVEIPLTFSDPLHLKVTRYQPWSNLRTQEINNPTYRLGVYPSISALPDDHDDGGDGDHDHHDGVHDRDHGGDDDDHDWPLHTFH